MGLWDGKLIPLFAVRVLRMVLVRRRRESHPIFLPAAALNRSKPHALRFDELVGGEAGDHATPYTPSPGRIAI